MQNTTSTATYQLGKLTGNPLAAYRRFRNDPIQFLYDTHPSGDVVVIPSVTGRPSFIVHHPEIVRALLSADSHEVHKGTSSEILGITLGQGLLTSEGAMHARQRQQMQPAFHASAVAGMFDIVVRHTRNRIATWPDGRAWMISSDMLDITLDIVFESLFGQPVGDARETIHQAVEQSVSFSAKRLMSAVPLPFYLPLPAHIRQRKSVNAFDDVIENVIQEARRSGRRDTLIGMLLAEHEGDPAALPHREIRDQVATLIIAGHETTANLVTWATYLLASHPDVMDRCFQEIQETVGDDLSYEDTKHLPYLKSVIQETLRLYPPAWTMLRETTTTLSVGDFTFPKKSSVIISPYVLHRNPRWFEDPDSFIPERFSADGQRTWPPFAFIPFGAGHRACIGSQLAQMESITMLALILQQFRLHLVPGTHVRPDPSVSLRVTGGLQLRFNRR